MTGSMRILLVDDEPITRKTLTLILQAFGFEVENALNGVEALAKLHEQDFGMLVTDWQMPEMDGITLCRRIREEFKEKYIYILMLTARMDQQSIIDGLEAGADDFLAKPPNFDELRVRLKTGTRIVDLQRQLAGRNLSLEQAYQQIRQDLDAAADTLRARLPRPARLNGFRFDWLFEPASMIGGDIFDVVQAPESSKSVFYQVDVAGHGVPAALSSFTIQSLLSEAAVRQLAAGGNDRRASWSTQPVEVANELNRRFQQAPDSNQYFTMLYGVMNHDSGEGLLVQAGHPPPLHWRSASNDVVEIGNGGFPIGLLPQASFEALHFRLAPHDRLLLYSDGVSDCTDVNGQGYDERLAQIVGETAGLPLETAIRRIREDLLEWRATDHFDDDVSLLMLEKS